MWYALVHDEQLGPMAAGELGDLFTSGVIDPETFIWREGMAEWLPLKAVPEFQEITLGAVADLGLYDYANEGEEDDDEEGATLMIGAGEAAGWSNYLAELANKAPAPPMQGAPVAAAPQRPAPAPRQRVPSEPPVDPVAHTEAMITPFEAGAAPAKPPIRSAFDDADRPQAPFALPDAGAHFEAPELAAPLEFGAEFSAPPMPGPVAPTSGGAGKTALIFVLLLLLGGGGALLFMYLRTPTDPVGPGPRDQAVSSGPAPVAVVEKDAAPPPRDAAVPDAAVPDAAAADAALEADAMVLEAIDIADEPDAGKGKTPVKLSAEEIARRREARQKRLDLMKAAEETKRAARAKATQGNLPKALGREDIQGVVRANADRISACAEKDEKAKGHASVSIVIERSGAVSRAKVVTARLRKSPAGDCVETAIKGLKFPRFSGDAMRINLPLKL